MRKNKVIFWVTSLLIALILIAVAYFYLIYQEENIKNVDISVIVYGDEAERWKNLKDGAEQATELYKDKYNIEINLVTVSKNSSQSEQMSLLEREIENGCNAVMLAVDDSQYVTDYLKSREINIPIVFIETGTMMSETNKTITADNYEMGCLLGESIIGKENPEIKVAVIKDNIKRSSVESRFKGINSILNKKNIKTVLWKRNKNEDEIETIFFLQRALVEEAVDVVVALDNESTEAIADAVTNLNKKVKIYGIANSDKAVNYLDRNTIQLLVYENEFNIGYLAVQKLLSEKENNQSNFDSYMEYRAITKEDMYSDNNEKLVFPFVK